MDMKVVKRTGEVVEFDGGRIATAITKAVQATSAQVSQDQISKVSEAIIAEVSERFTDFFPNVENVQDIVEKHLVKQGHYEIAKEYILYRAKRQKARDREKKDTVIKAKLGRLTVKKRSGRTTLFDAERMRQTIVRASAGHDQVNTDIIAKEAIKNIYDGVPTDEVERALIMSAVSFIEKDPAYSNVSARLFLQKIYKEVMGRSITGDHQDLLYRECFIQNIRKGVELNLFDKRLLDFDLDRMSQGMIVERDQQFQYIGIQTLYERYFTKDHDKRLELPQAFWMRVAMGLAIEEENKEEMALSFYEVLSSFRFVSSTPTLFHSGTSHPQLSSCYLTTINDDLSHIFKCLGDNSQLSKWSGGIGNDWTNIRATGSWISSTNVESQGVIPFLKIANDVTMAINRSGKRRGATCAYLETWHLDVEDFLDLRKNTGDDRRRTHDMNTSNWIPDVFMKRVLEGKDWTLFSPEEVPELHHLYGRAFEHKYVQYEQKAAEGKIRKFKTIEAKKLWRKMLTMLFETGHPWITFKDPCNVRSPQDHCGVVHSSNLCTEITLNTSETETAVCNLGSVNLEKHIHQGKLDEEVLSKTVRTAIRMLDNVIDINFYPTVEAKNSNMKHRPIGLGIMGFQDALFKMDLAFDSDEAMTFADSSMEMVSYYAIMGSSEIAKEKGTYSSYKGSKWDRNIFPVDTIGLLEQERGMKIDCDTTEHLNWAPVREHVKEHGMRNSNVMAIAPTATISNVAGCFPCIEPIYKNMYVKANISGEFTVVNKYLVEDLKKNNLWNEEMLEQIKYYDGSVQNIPGIPDGLKAKYKEAFEIDPVWLINHASARGKWIDQSQSLNVFVKGTSGKLLNDVYSYAWQKGLKTTYYLRSLAATQIEKSTLDAAKYGFTQKRQYADANPKTVEAPKPVVKQSAQVAAMMDGICESCQ